MKPTPPVSSPVAAALRRICALCAVGAAAPVLVVLAGWAVGSEDLERFVPGEASMKLNTALATGFLVAAFFPSLGRRAATACGALAAASGGAVLVEYLVGAGTRFDELLVHDPVASAHPGRMAPNSAAVLCLLGTAAVLLRRRGTAARVGHGLALVALAICCLALVGVSADERQLYGGYAVYMAIPAVIAFTLVSVAAVLFRLDVGLGAMLSRADVEGQVLRATLGPAMAIPIVVALGRSGIVALGVSRPAADWLYTLAGVAVMGAAAVVGARRLGRSAAAIAEANERVRAIVELSGLAILTVDTSGIVTSWNRTAELMLGYTADEVIGKRYPLASGEDFDELMARFSRFADGETLEEDRTRRRKDGTMITIRVALAPVRDVTGGFAGVSAVIADVSERRAAEEALWRLNDELEVHVAERTAELLAANRELQAFSYSVSHDLRAPLRALDGFATALEEDYGHKLDETAHHYLSRIRGAAARMSTLIDDVLQMARVTRMELRRERVDVTALAREVAADVRAGALEAAAVDLYVEEGLTAVADVALLRVVLQNLLENAWKFSARADAPRVEVRAGADGALVVADNGVGFDGAYADKLFAPFQRLHATTDFPGNGIGLATAQNIVNRHGGTIRAESAVGQGATFTFTLGSAPAVADGERTPYLTAHGG
jgi:PAS domain S-box-containing protein